MHVGLVSDTHGRFDPALPRILAGCELILHAGDVAGLEILHQLSAIAPVQAVRGNVDVGELGAGLEEQRIMRLGELTALLVHDVGSPERPHAQVCAAIEAEGVRLVVYGHSHVPDARRVGEVLFVNPGSAGPRRFDLPRSAAVLTIAERQVQVQFLDLQAGGEPLRSLTKFDL